MEITPTPEKVTPEQFADLGFTYMDRYKSIDAIYEFQDEDERVSLTIGKFTKGIRVQRKYTDKMNTVEWMVTNDFDTLLKLLIEIKYAPAKRVERERKIASLDK